MDAASAALANRIGEGEDMKKLSLRVRRLMVAALTSLQNLRAAERRKSRGPALPARVGSVLTTKERCNQWLFVECLEETARLERAT